MRKTDTHTEVLVSSIDSMRTGVDTETSSGLLYVGLNIKRGSGDAACDLIVGAARVMDVREAIGFLSHLITEGRADLMAMARKYEADKIKAEG